MASCRYSELATSLLPETLEKFGLIPEGPVTIPTIVSSSKGVIVAFELPKLGWCTIHFLLEGDQVFTTATFRKNVLANGPPDLIAELTPVSPDLLPPPKKNGNKVV